MDFNASDFDLDALALLKAKKRNDDGSLTPLDPPRESPLRELIAFVVDDMLDSKDGWENILIVCRKGSGEQYPVIHTEDQIRAVHQRIIDEKASSENEQDSGEPVDEVSDDAASEEPPETNGES